jgi:pimeloyl-ACP methyl ester carboxylesterase
MPYTVIHGNALYYEVYGDGDPIILLHHGFGCTRMWKEISPVLIDEGYRVIMYDRRGYGRSEAGNDFEAFYVSNGFRPASIRELEFLMDYLQIDSFHLLGQCEGGVVAVDFASLHHDRVQSVITSSTQCYSTVPMKAFNESKFPNDFQSLEPELKQKLLVWHGAERAEAFYNQFRKFGGAYGTELFDLRPKLSGVLCPALVLYPDRSFLFEVEQGVAFHRHLPQGELAVIPKCGHNTYEQQPAEYARQVLAFLRRHGF